MTIREKTLTTEFVLESRMWMGIILDLNADGPSYYKNPQLKMIEQARFRCDRLGNDTDYVRVYNPEEARRKRRSMIVGGKLREPKWEVKESRSGADPFLKSKELSL